MSDGEIFYDIENGIRMSGMPAFGGPDTADDSWNSSISFAICQS